MATQEMTMYYCSETYTVDANGNYTYVQTPPNYSALAPYVIGVINGGLNINLKDGTSQFNYGGASSGMFPMVDLFLFDDSNLTAVLNCYQQCGYYVYHTCAVTSNGTFGTEPPRTHI